MKPDNFIKDTWDNQAREHKESHWASWGDNFAIDLEIGNISHYINEGDLVLDVGCSNGHATIKQLAKNPRKIFGIDFSEEMIKYADSLKANNNLNEKLEFLTGDILHIPFEDNKFDVTYTTRVLINLPNWEAQKKGISECIRVTRKGGKIILSEAFWEPLVLLNSIRTLKNLPPLVEHDFNRYLKFSKTEEFLNRLKLEYQRIDFSSIYYLGSRFLRELVTNPTDYEGYSNPINKIFYDIEKEFSGGGFGIQQAYIITK